MWRLVNWTEARVIIRPRHYAGRFMESLRSQLFAWKKRGHLVIVEHRRCSVGSSGYVDSLRGVECVSCRVPNALATAENKGFSAASLRSRALFKALFVVKVSTSCDSLR